MHQSGNTLAERFVYLVHTWPITEMQIGKRNSMKGVFAAHQVPRWLSEPLPSPGNQILEYVFSSEAIVSKNID